MKLSILQTAPAWRKAAESIAEADRLLAETGETDLIALPEMWPTGFDAHPATGTAPWWAAWLGSNARCARGFVQRRAAWRGTGRASGATAASL